MIASRPAAPFHARDFVVSSADRAGLSECIKRQLVPPAPPAGPPRVAAGPEPDARPWFRRRRAATIAAVLAARQLFMYGPKKL